MHLNGIFFNSLTNRADKCFCFTHILVNHTCPFPLNLTLDRLIYQFNISYFVVLEKKSEVWISHFMTLVSNPAPECFTLRSPHIILDFWWRLCGLFNKEFMCMAVHVQGSHSYYDSGVTSHSCRRSRQWPNCLICVSFRRGDPSLMTHLNQSKDTSGSRVPRLCRLGCSSRSAWWCFGRLAWSRRTDPHPTPGPGSTDPSLLISHCGLRRTHKDRDELKSSSWVRTEPRAEVPAERCMQNQNMLFYS